MASCYLGAGLDGLDDAPVHVPRLFLSKDRDAEESEAAFSNLLPPLQAVSAGGELGGIHSAAYGIEAIGQVLAAISLQDEVGEHIANSRTRAGLMSAAIQLARSIQGHVEEVHRAVAHNRNQGGEA